MKKLYEYLVKISFSSAALNRVFKPGEIIKAPAELGNQWTKQKLTIKLKHNEQERNPGTSPDS